MLVHVDPDRCCGAGQCVLAAPDVFDQDERDGTVVLLAARPPADLAREVADAVAACPGGAIRLEEGVPR
ncbi:MULTISPECIES: ferredoxin [Kitasatospora]|uniref:Ferredoxin n=1 Tax=Kitasatospora setae (strain ATCC 33774 / DSM 43861 / JCM 3304 / KCC A-0304 / NBRC 14216 / KM-6054) TaxID=452652 RepID=E4N5M3_KITSK|nr:ferredoxin [Kitasatospora setae]BAJ26504.1 putative 3Fe-4S ferredoxin [Kitasatospora setae KM-6054]